MTYSQNIDSLRVILNDLEGNKSLLLKKLNNIKKEFDDTSIRIDSIKNIITQIKIKNDTTIKSYTIKLFKDTDFFLDANHELRLGKIPKRSTITVFNKFEGFFVKISYKEKVAYISYWDIMVVLPDDFKTQFWEYRSIAGAEKKQKDNNKRKLLEEKSKQLDIERKRNLQNKFGNNAGDLIYNRQIWLGMTDEMARVSRGKPNDINRSVGSWGVHEQWIYKKGKYDSYYLYFENGKLTSWQD